MQNRTARLSQASLADIINSSNMGQYCVAEVFRDRSGFPGALPNPLNPLPFTFLVLQEAPGKILQQ